MRCNLAFLASGGIVFRKSTPKGNWNQWVSLSLSAGGTRDSCQDVLEGVSKAAPSTLAWSSLTPPLNLGEVVIDMAEGDPRDASQWVAQQPGGQRHPSTNGDLLHRRALTGATSDARSDDSFPQVDGRVAPFRGMLPLPQPPPYQHQIQPGSASFHGAPAVSSVDVMAATAAAPSTAPSATVSSATASFVTSAVNGGWFIGDPGSEPGGAPEAAVTVMPIALTPQGENHNTRYAHARRRRR